MKMSKNTFRRLIPTMFYLFVNPLFIYMTVFEINHKINGDLIPLAVSVVFSTIVLIVIQFDMTKEENFGDFKGGLYMASLTPGFNLIILSVFTFLIVLTILSSILSLFKKIFVTN